MALLFIEGFENYPGTITSNQSERLFGKWGTFQANLSTTSPRFTDGGRYVSDSARGNFVARDIGQNLEAGCIGVALNPGNTGSYNANIITLFDGDYSTAANVQLCLKLNNDLTLSVCRNTHANVLGTTSSSLSVGTWSYIELKFKISDSISAGDVIVYVNGASVLELSASSDTKHTSNSYVTGYRFNGAIPSITSGGNSTLTFDDHYLIDFTGSRNNAPLGNCRVITIRPDGNGSTSQLTGSDGNSTNNYLLVDEVGEPNSDTDYVESATPGQLDTYSMGNLPANTNTILGIQTSLYVKKTDTDPRSAVGVVRVDGLDYELDDTGDLTTTYLNYRTILEEKPSDSTTWQVSDVDAIELGMKVSS